MANYVPFARSNYFSVKDTDAFRAWCQKLDLEFIEGDDKNTEGLVGFLSNNEQGIPFHHFDGQDDEVEDFDFLGELSAHLQEGQVAVVMEVGFEKMRYLNGYAVAVNARNEQVSVNIDEIYERAKALGGNITVAAY